MSKFHCPKESKQKQSSAVDEFGSGVANSVRVFLDSEISRRTSEADRLVRQAKGALQAEKTRRKAQETLSLEKIAGLTAELETANALVEQYKTRVAQLAPAVVPEIPATETKEDPAPAEPAKAAS